MWFFERAKTCSTALPVAVAAVFTIKLIVVLQLKDHPLLQEDAGLDTSVYLDLARQVLAGNVALGPGLYFVSPLYIYFTAAVLSVADSLLAVRLAQAVLGTGAVGCIFIAAREWFGRAAAFSAAVVATLTGLFTFYESLILQAALDPFLTAAALAGLALGLNRGGAHYFAITGMALGVQAMNRPNTLLAAGVVCGLMLLLRLWRGGAWLLVGTALALSPLAVRNGVVAGVWSPVASHGGLNFYIGNNAQADGTYRSVAGITPNIAGQQADTRRVAGQALGREVSDAEASAYFYARGRAWIAQHPGAAARLFVRKMLLVFSAEHLWLNYSFPFFRGDVATLLPALFIGPWLLVPLGLAGLIACRPAARRREYLVWTAFVPAYAVAVALFFVAERYRLPVLVPLCVGAGALAAGMIDAFRTGAWATAAVPAVIALAIAPVANWPLALDHGRGEQRLRMAERLIARERYAEAEEWSAKAIGAQQPAASVHFRVGRALLARQQRPRALSHLQEAARLDPDRPEISYALGQALLDDGRAAEAVAHLRRALQAGVRRDVTGFDLARALAATGQSEEALRVLREVRPADERDATSWIGLAQLAEQLRAPALAIDFYRSAIAAAPNVAATRERLGLMLAVSGDLRGAASEFERASRLDPSDASIHLNLAVAYARLDRTAEARARAEEALRLDPTYTRARELLRGLDR
jgi:tetratricopeptide (TPR) repeat protein